MSVKESTLLVKGSCQHHKREGGIKIPPNSQIEMQRCPNKKAKVKTELDCS